MRLTRLICLAWAVFLSGISLADLAFGSIINFSLGFIAPMDKSLGPTAELGQELASAYKLAVEAVNQKAISDKSKVRFSANFSDLIHDEGGDPLSCKQAGIAFHSKNTVVGIVGGYSSLCSITLQRQLITMGSNLSEISYGSTVIDLSDKLKYPRFFRTCPSDINQAQALADLVHHFRWRKVGVIGSNDLYGKGIVDNFLIRANSHGILIKERASFLPEDSVDMLRDQLQKLKNAGTRVNVVVAEGKKLFQIFREAAKKKMTGEGWVWIGSDRSSSTWLGEESDVMEAAKGLVSLSPAMPTGSNLLQLVTEWFGKGPNYPGIIWKSPEPVVSPYVAEVYDAVFAYYKAINVLLNTNTISEHTPIDAIREMVFEQLLNFKDESSGFLGLSGHAVYFDIDGKTHDPPGHYDILNFRGKQYVHVGKWSEQSSGISLPAGVITWPGGSKATPTDRGSPGKPLYKIGFVVPINKRLGALGTLGIELLSAFRIAVNIVNTGQDYNVELDIKIYDEGVDGQRSCEEVANNLIHDQVTAVVGAYRSQCSIVLSRILGSSKHAIPIISYGSSAADLSNKTHHQLFFRVVPSADHQAKALVEFIRRYNFREVGKIFTTNTQSEDVACLFSQGISNWSVPLKISAKISSNANAFVVRKEIEKVKDAGSHVNVISALTHDAESIYQQLKELSMTGKGWAFFADADATATSFSGNKDLANALHGLIGLSPKAGEGHLYLKFLSTWLSNDQAVYPGIVHSQATPKSLPFTSQVFDAVNGIAIALSDLVLKKEISYNTLTSVVRQKLYQRLRQYNDLSNGYPSATGLGAMYFDQNQDGPAIVDVVNLVDSSWKTIGSYSGTKQMLSLSQDPIFPGGLTIPIVGAGKTMYRIAGLFPKNQGLGPLSELGSLWEKAFKEVVQWINRNQSLEVGFHFLSYDTGFDERACAQTAKAIPDDVDFVIGEARSACTQAVYQSLSSRGVPMITYASTAGLLNDKTLYPTLFRTCARDDYQADALNKLIEKFHWDKVGIIASDNTYGSGLSSRLKDSLEENSVRIVRLLRFLLDPKPKTPVHLSKLKEAGSGVNVVIAPTTDAERVFQEAFELGMTGKGWTWLGSDGATSATFSKSHHLQIAMQGMVGLGPKRGDSTLFDSIMRGWDPEPSSKKRQIPYVAQIFDSVLAISEALERLHAKKLVSQTSTHQELRSLVTGELRAMKTPTTGFSSTTGDRLYFDKDQDGLPAYDLLNLNGASWVKVGSYDAAGLKLTSNVVWSGGTIKTPPSDPPSVGTVPINSSSSSKSPDTGLVVLSVIFGSFGLLVLAFMAYIIRRVRYRHLYMQSDATSGGLFSVLYGHRQSHSFRNVQSRVVQHSNGNTLKETELNDLPAYSVPRLA